MIFVIFNLVYADRNYRFCKHFKDYVSLSQYLELKLTYCDSWKSADYIELDVHQI